MIDESRRRQALEGPVRQQEKRVDHRQNDDAGHEWDGIDPDGQQEPYP